MHTVAPCSAGLAANGFPANYRPLHELGIFNRRIQSNRLGAARLRRGRRIFRGYFAFPWEALEHVVSRRKLSVKLRARTRIASRRQKVASERGSFSRHMPLIPEHFIEILNGDVNICLFVSFRKG